LRQQYSSYDECISFFKKAQKEHPELFEVQSIGKTWEGREIVAVTITKNVVKHAQKPALFYTGTIHAREWIGIELALAFAKYIIEHIDYDPTLNTVLDAATLYMVPCANPDGFEYSRNHFSFWRKNRRKNPDGTYGVDLNRNFSVGFSPNKNYASNVYSGPEPFSEPETRALRDFFEEHKNISIALDYHSQGNVFFPAHNFIHEDAQDAIDLNILAANMAEEIRKESGREYGVHMGKPPTHLISGSGREFYYSKGALALVVEVGTRNISDYIEHMREHIDENIPALIEAMRETKNYSHQQHLPRVESFCASSIGAKEITLSWDYMEDETLFFEIYRSTKKKGYAQSSNRIGTTKLKSFTDRNLHPATNYYYYLRAVCKDKNIKSPFAQMVGVRTKPAESMFSKILYPLASKIGYVGEKTRKNAEHFGNNSLFVGISEKKGECLGVIGFSLQTIPENAIITEAKISFYPMNRVAVQVERYGEWRVGQMDERTIENIASFDEIKNAKMLSYIDRPTASSQLSQGIWRTYTFAAQEIEILQKSLKRREAFFRMEGPKTLPLDRASQLMQWDIGYGRFSGGLTYRPKLDISYTINEAKLDLISSAEFTVNEDDVKDESLHAGFDENGSQKYACFEFDMGNLPDIQTTVVSKAYIELEAAKVVSKSKSLRFHIEMIEPIEGYITYEKIKNRKVIERIGYDVSLSDLNENSKQRFVFDRYAINEMIAMAPQTKKVLFVIYASTHKEHVFSEYVDWMDSKRIHRPTLTLHYIKKRKNPPKRVSELRYKIENNIIKLEWINPDDDGFKGVIVVKNPFKVPCSPYDGQKLYGGKDNYTYDSFGDKEVHKYYAVYTYDDVPNFSEPTYIEINI
jgi:hypothetical protein